MLYLVGGGKWAPRVAHDTCSLLGGGEGARHASIPLNRTGQYG